MHTVRIAFCVAFGILACVPSAQAQDVARASVQMRVEIAARTSLTVSSDVLQFAVADGGGIATAAVDFTAGARLPSGGGVVLSVEPLRAVQGPGGAADVETWLSFQGEGPGLLTGTLGSADTVVGRWTGSGRRVGRVIFTLRAAASGRYALPVRFVLSAP